LSWNRADLSRAAAAELTGGHGHDSVNNVDRITDFKHGIDKIDLSHAIFSALNPGSWLHHAMFHVGPKAADHSDHIIYNPANGWLSYDADGHGGAPAIHFATLAPHLALTAHDFYVI
jgi:Ca2+-binding RTX toxin-like protein